MLMLQPQILEKDGKGAFAILPYDEFMQMTEALSDYEDLKVLREAKRQEADAPTTSVAHVNALLGV